MKTTQEQIEDDNMKEALEFAKNIYKIVTEKKFSQTYNAEERHKILIKQYPNFATAYPLILKFIAKDLKYNENAFKKFLNKLRADPGKGMDGFISRQADYAKFLYIEDCKSRRQHINMKRANEIWNLEYSHMHKYVKKLEKEEKLAKNEFEEEQKIHLELKRKELLDFILGTNMDSDTNMDLDTNMNSDTQTNNLNTDSDIDTNFNANSNLINSNNQTNNSNINSDVNLINADDQTLAELLLYIRNLRDIMRKKNIPDPRAFEDLPKLSNNTLVQYINTLEKLISAKPTS